MTLVRFTNSIAFVFLVLAEAAGGFTLARLGPAYDLGLLGTVRLWLVLGFVVFAGVSRFSNPFSRREPALLGGLGIAALHLLLLVSLWWSPATAGMEDEILNLVLIVVTMPLAGLLFLSDADLFQRLMLRMLFILGLAALPIAFFAFSEISTELSLRSVGSIRIARTAGLGAVAASALWAVSGRGYWLLPVPLLGLVMVASGNRASVLSFMVSLVPLVLLTRKTRVIKATVFLGLLTGLAAWFVPLVTDVFRFFVEYAIWEANGRLYLADRGQLFTIAWRLFMDSPWIGQGFGGYWIRSGLYYAYPHNLTLNFASELGLSGLVPYAAIVSLGSWVGLRDANPTQIGMSSVFVYLFVAAQFSGTYGDAFFMWVALVALLARSSGTNEDGAVAAPPFLLPSQPPTFPHGSESSAGS